MAAKLGAKKVFAVEPSYLHETMTRAYIEANDVKDKITIIKKEPLNLSKEDLEMEEVNVLISEPYFVNSIRPWDLTCFLCSRLSLRDILPSDVKVIPQIGRLRAVAVDFEDLWKIRAPVNTVEGFNITKFDQMIQKAISLTDAVIEPHPLWEYPCKPLSDAFNLLKFDYATGNSQNKVEVCGEQPITSSGTCNGVALWADFYVDDTILTTGPVKTLKPDCPISWYMNSQQGVYFINPLSVTTGN
ncbi:Protein arginine N-methyltransferase 7, partial [Stegodyphus mimosarum]